MPSSALEEKFLHTNRRVLCPRCNSEFYIPLTTLEYCCGNCGEILTIEPEWDYSEEFVWHPSKKF